MKNDNFDDDLGINKDHPYYHLCRRMYLAGQQSIKNRALDEVSKGTYDESGDIIFPQGACNRILDGTD